MMALRDAFFVFPDVDGAAGGGSIRIPGGRDAGRLPASRPASAERAEGPPPRSANPAGAPLASLAGGALARRFRAWRGASGRRYVVTVYAAGETGWLDLDAALALVVAVAPDGRRRILAAHVDPDAPARRRLAAALVAAEGEACEVHLHLLAATPAERAAAAADLGAGAGLR
ncbi:MAG: hypothetical protein JNK46_08105 [Methylobacteriaceae bacterium]|nr:hypothetical protein [Methylobacteriaceae bacterium]